MPAMWSVIAVAAVAALPAQAADTCLRATHDLAAGAVPAASDFATADCDGARPLSAVRYDAAIHAVRLSRRLESGERIAAFPAAMVANIVPGQKLFVQVHVGPVVVEREVEALQPANPGQRLFVRAADGTVMSVRYGGDAG